MSRNYKIYIQVLNEWICAGASGYCLGFVVPREGIRAAAASNSGTGITTSKTTNATGLLESSTDPGGVITYTYYSDGQLKSTTTPDGNQTLISYDAYGRQTLLNDPDAKSISYSYNALGQLQHQTDTLGVTMEMHYDKAGRLIAQHGNSSDGSQTTTLTNTYYPVTAAIGSRGLPSSTLYTDEAGNTVRYNYSYSNKEQLSQKEIISSARVFTYNYQYDDLGNLKEYTYPSGYTIAYDYNSGNGSVKKVSQKSDSKVIYEPLDFNPRGQLLHYKIANGSIFSSFEYDEYGMPSFIKTGKNTAGASEIQKLETNFNKFTGNLEYRKDDNYFMNGNVLTENFTYDNDFNNCLGTWQVVTQPQFSMSYQKESGNIRTKSDFTSTANEYQYSATHPHAIDHVKQPILMPAEATQNTSYNLAGKIKKIEHIQQNKHLDISYGPYAERIKSTQYSGNTISKTKFFIGGDFEVEISQNGTERYLHYLPGGGLFISHSATGSDSLNYILTDYQGSWYKVITENGNTIEHYSFDPWGRRRNATNWTYTGVPTSFHYDRGYTGHEMLDAYGLINMNGRVYDPIVARFLSPDKYVQNPQFSQSYNRYSYCFNNPLKFSDPSGMQSIYRGTYNPSQPSSSSRGKGAPQVEIDGLRFSDTFGYLGGAGGFEVENIEYGGDLTSIGIYSGDRTSPDGVYIYNGTQYLSMVAKARNSLSIKGDMAGYDITPYFTYGKITMVLSKGDPKIYGSDATGYIALGESFGVWYGDIAQSNGGGDGGLGNWLSAFDIAAGDYSEYGHNHTTYTTTKGIVKNIYKANGEVRSARAAGFARTSRFVKGLGVAGSIVSTTYSGYKVVDQFQTGGIQNVNGWDATDTGVGLLGLGATGAVYLGLISNPVGWAIGAGVLIYSGSRLAYDLYNEP